MLHDALVFYRLFVRAGFPCTVAYFSIRELLADEISEAA